MKIGIITQPLRTNYGGLLQNYALQQVLKRIGHNVITLDQKGVEVPFYRKLIQCLKLFHNYILGRKAEQRNPFAISEKQLSLISRNTQEFIDNYIVHTDALSNKQQFRDAIFSEKIDALIVGSDQVWRPKYNFDIRISFFNFAEGINIKRLSYAASFGVDNWEYNKKESEDCKKLVQKFDAISVRETSAIGLCENYFEMSPTFVLDPTMLLNKEDYINLVETASTPLSKGNLFVYLLDKSNEKMECVYRVAKKLNLTYFTAMPKHSIYEKNADIENCVFPNVEQWLRAFIDAEFVVCDSFHGAVFSIIFNKPFVILANERRGLSRFDSLLKTFSLEERLVTKDTLSGVVHKPINWDSINLIREKLKENSINYLKQNLR